MTKCGIRFAPFAGFEVQWRAV